jgi:hypothetical protein
MEILQLHALKPSLHRLPYRIDLVSSIAFLVTPRQGLPRNTPFPSVPLLLLVNSLRGESLYRAVAQKLPRYIRPSSGRCIPTALRATRVYTSAFSEQRLCKHVPGQWISMKWRNGVLYVVRTEIL